MLKLICNKVFLSNSLKSKYVIQHANFTKFGYYKFNAYSNKIKQDKYDETNNINNTNEQINNKSNKSKTHNEKEEDNEDVISFGYKTVKKDERQSMVNEVFANVAQKYDIMNDAMSLGIHRIWKNEFVNSIGHLKPNLVKNAENILVEEPMQIIDVAGGTGDISFRIHERAKYFAKNYFSNF